MKCLLKKMVILRKPHYRKAANLVGGISGPRLRLDLSLRWNRCAHHFNAPNNIAEGMLNLPRTNWPKHLKNIRNEEDVTAWHFIFFADAGAPAWVNTWQSSQILDPHNSRQNSARAPPSALSLRILQPGLQHAHHPKPTFNKYSMDAGCPLCFRSHEVCVSLPE